MGNSIAGSCACGMLNEEYMFPLDARSKDFEKVENSSVINRNETTSNSFSPSSKSSNSTGRKMVNGGNLNSAAEKKETEIKPSPKRRCRQHDSYDFYHYKEMDEMRNDVDCGFNSMSHGESRDAASFIASSCDCGSVTFDDETGAPSRRIVTAEENLGGRFDLVGMNGHLLSANPADVDGRGITLIQTQSRRFRRRMSRSSLGDSERRE